MTHPRAFAALAALVPLVVMAQTPKHPKVSIPDYSQTERAKVPIAVTWNIADLFKDDGAWRAEFDAVKLLAGSVDGLAKGWTGSAGAMATFLERTTEVELRSRKLYAYASLQGDADLGDVRFQKLKGEMQSFLVGYNSRLAFVDADILKLGRERLEAYLKAEPRLAPYRFGLEKTLRGKEHVLPEAEERIVAQAGLFSGATDKASDLLNNVDMPKPEVTLADGTKLLLNQANYQKYRSDRNPENRRKVMEAYWTNQKRFENTFAALMDGAVKSHLFGAQVHHHPACLDAALFGDAIEPAVYRNLVATVRANLAPLHRYLKLRQRMLGLPEFRYGDVYASAVASVDRTYTFDEARERVLAATAPLGPDYRKGLERAFRERWIDIYPNLGKQGGAYSSGVFGVHPYVKMNFDGSYREVSTLAHELGHSMHSYFADAAQPAPTAEYPIFLAEIASTFNENLLVNDLLASEKDVRFKLYLLDNYLEGLRGTLYRQTLFADFELAMHERVEQGQSLTADWLNAKYLELTRLYYGHDAGVVKVDDYIQSEWSGIPHFYYDFYVFQYATGIVASTALADMVRTGDAAARDRYLAFLKAGGSDFPLNTLRKAGVDMATPQPVERALKAFDHLVGEMEALYDKIQAAGK